MTRRTLLLAGILSSVLVVSGSAEAQYGGHLNVNVPVSGVFTPFLPIDASGKPFVDYQFVVHRPGTYQIDLVSSNTSGYDPYLIIMSGGRRVASNDDGGNGLNSRLMTFLNPGHYSVRVTRFGSGPVQYPVPFTLSITAAIAPTPRPMPAPPMGGMLTDAMARVLALRFYSSQSEWAGQYAMNITQTRLVQVGPNQVQLHARYQYTCIRARCRGARSGFDQRVFYFQRYGAQWQVVRMGGHMSARF